MIDPRKLKGVRASLDGLAADLALAAAREHHATRRELLERCEQDVMQMVELVDVHHPRAPGKRSTLRHPRPPHAGRRQP